MSQEFLFDKSLILRRTFKKFMITKYFFSLLLKNCLKFEHYFSIWLKKLSDDLTMTALHYIVNISYFTLHCIPTLRFTNYIVHIILYTFNCPHQTVKTTLYTLHCFTHFKLHITLNVFQLEIWESE